MTSCVIVKKSQMTHYQNAARAHGQWTRPQGFWGVPKLDWGALLSGDRKALLDDERTASLGMGPNESRKSDRAASGILDGRYAERNIYTLAALADVHAIGDRNHLFALEPFQKFGYGSGSSGEIKKYLERPRTSRAE